MVDMLQKKKEKAETKDAIVKEGRDINTCTSMRKRCLFLTFSVHYKYNRMSKYWGLSSTDTRKYRVWAEHAV